MRFMPLDGFQNSANKISAFPEKTKICWEPETYQGLWTLLLWFFQVKAMKFCLIFISELTNIREKSLAL